MQVLRVAVASFDMYVVDVTQLPGLQLAYGTHAGGLNPEQMPCPGSASQDGSLGLVTRQQGGDTGVLRWVLTPQDHCCRAHAGSCRLVHGKL